MKFSNLNKYVSTTIVLIFIVGLILIPFESFAQTRTDTNPQPRNVVDTNPQPKTGGTFTLSNPLNVDSVAGLVQSFVEIFSYVVIILAVLALIWVGFQFIIARGDVAKMTQMKNWLFWIVVGVAVVIGARVIIEIVINTLAATNVVDQGTLNSVRGAIPR